MSPSTRKQRRHGFTLVEISIVLLLVSALMGVTFRIFQHIVQQRRQGLVDLQELHDARMAISSLRRDFRSAAPKVPTNASLALKWQAIQRPAVAAGSFNPASGLVPIVVGAGEVHFARQRFDTPDLDTSPATDEVSYHIHPTRKCLVRVSAGHEQFFNDIKDVKFELYGHPLQKNVPMLLVTLMIDADTQATTSNKQYLEITTAIASPVANQNINNPHWYRTYF